MRVVHVYCGTMCASVPNGKQQLFIISVNPCVPCYHMEKASIHVYCGTTRAWFPYGKHNSCSCLLRNHVCLVPIWKNNSYSYELRNHVCRVPMEITTVIHAHCGTMCALIPYGENDYHSCVLRNHVCLVPIWKKQQLFMFTAEPCVPRSHVEGTPVIHAYCGTMCSSFPY